MRVAFSFCVGLSLLLFLALVMPYARGAWVRDVVVVMFYFPLLVALGAGAEVTPEMERVCRFSGELSYPLYMTHQAVISIWIYVARKHSLAFHGFGVATACGVLSSVAVAWTILKLYDEPVRAYLRKRV